MSVAYYETGDYAAAISACDTALALLAADAPDHDAIRQKHLIRKAKASIFATSYDDGADIVQFNVDLFAAEEALLHCSKQYVFAEALVEDSARARNAIVLTLPRYKPSL